MVRKKKFSFRKVFSKFFFSKVNHNLQRNFGPNCRFLYGGQTNLSKEAPQGFAGADKRMGSTRSGTEKFQSKWDRNDRRSDCLRRNGKILNLRNKYFALKMLNKNLFCGKRTKRATATTPIVSNQEYIREEGYDIIKLHCCGKT